MSARIYKVTDKQTGNKHLVKATNQAQAVRHVAQSRLDVAVASAIETVELMNKGAVVENATAKGGEE